MALLEVEDLRVGYGFPVLMGISFEVEEGETAVLFGLNGAGKTTTVATIAGLLKPDGGSIRFAGEEIGGRGPTKLVDRGHRAGARGPAGVPRPQRGQQPAPRRVDAAAATGDLVEERRQLVFEYFPRLAERQDQAAGTLSGGEQQMLAIGRAIMSKPKLLLIDEASLGLSPALAKVVFQVVKRINDDGVTVIIVEQNVGVLPYADRALIMEKGTLIFSGVGDEIRSANLRETLPRRTTTDADRRNSMKNGWARFGGVLGIVYCVAGFFLIFLGWNGAATYDHVRGPDPVRHVRRDRRAGPGRARLGADRRPEPAQRQRAPWPPRPWRRPGPAGAGGRPGRAPVAPRRSSPGRPSYHRAGCRVIEGQADVVTMTRRRTAARRAHAVPRLHPGCDRASPSRVVPCTPGGGQPVQADVGRARPRASPIRRRCGEPRRQRCRLGRVAVAVQRLEHPGQVAARPCLVGPGPVGDVLVDRLTQVPLGGVEVAGSRVAATPMYPLTGPTEIPASPPRRPARRTASSVACSTAQRSASSSALGDLDQVQAWRQEHLVVAEQHTVRVDELGRAGVGRRRSDRLDQAAQPARSCHVRRRGLAATMRSISGTVPASRPRSSASRYQIPA